MFESIAVFSRRSILPALALLLALGAAGRAEEKITREFSRQVVLEPGRKVELNNPVGAVKITGWERDVVLVKAVIKCDRKWFEENRIKAGKALDKANIDVTENETGVRIETRIEDLEISEDDLGFFDTCRLVFGLIRKGLKDNLPLEVSFEVMVPSRSDLALNCDIGELCIADIEGKVSVRGDIGKITLENIRGDIYARNDIGEIEISNAAGSVDAKTSMGAVEVDIAELAPDDQVQLETGMGEVRLKIPSDARVDITTDCGMGGIDNNLGESFVCRSRKGDVRGSYNGGGAKISLETGMGRIEIANR